MMGTPSDIQLQRKPSMINGPNKHVHAGRDVIDSRQIDKSTF